MELQINELRDFCYNESLTAGWHTDLSTGELLDRNKGKTFARWISLLGGKSVNGESVLLPHEESVPYHIYYDVLNAKEHGVPQNRERIFIVGIRDDEANSFKFPNPFPLEKRLKDVLESNVDEKYFLSEKMIAGLIKTADKSYINQNTQASQVFDINDSMQTICAGTHGYANGYIELPNNQKLLNRNKYNNYSESEISATITAGGTAGAHNLSLVLVPSNTKKGYDIAEEEEDSINFSNPNSKTRRGRVGKKVSQTLDTACNQGVFTNKRIRRLTPLECFRLMDFNENFKANVADTHKYKQAGNSVVVKHFEDILNILFKTKKS